MLSVNACETAQEADSAVIMSPGADKPISQNSTKPERSNSTKLHHSCLPVSYFAGLQQLRPVRLASMPCVHCASRDTALTASTSSRCSSSVPVQRVFQWERSYKQLRRQLRRSRTAVQRAFFQGSPHPQQQTQQVNTLDSRPFAQQGPALTQTPQQLGRCMMQGFAAATVLTFLAPGASYSAESLPIGLLKSWIVSVEAFRCGRKCFCLQQTFSHSVCSGTSGESWTSGWPAYLHIDDGLGRNDSSLSNTATVAGQWTVVWPCAGSALLPTLL